MTENHGQHLTAREYLRMVWIDLDNGYPRRRIAERIGAYLQATEPEDERS